MSKKLPSDRSIRGALTTLKKAGILGEIKLSFEDGYMIFGGRVKNELITPKKSLKKRLPKQKKVGRSISVCNATIANSGHQCSCADGDL